MYVSEESEERSGSAEGVSGMCLACSGDSESHHGWKDQQGGVRRFDQRAMAR